MYGSICTHWCPMSGPLVHRLQLGALHGLRCRPARGTAIALRKTPIEYVSKCRCVPGSLPPTAQLPLLPPPSPGTGSSGCGVAQCHRRLTSRFANRKKEAGGRAFQRVSVAVCRPGSSRGLRPRRHTSSNAGCDEKVVMRRASIVRFKPIVNSSRDAAQSGANRAE